MIDWLEELANGSLSWVPYVIGVILTFVVILCLRR